MPVKYGFDSFVILLQAIAVRGKRRRKKHFRWKFDAVGRLTAGAALFYSHIILKFTKCATDTLSDFQSAAPL